MHQERKTIEIEMYCGSKHSKTEGTWSLTMVWCLIILIIFSGKGNFHFIRSKHCSIFTCRMILAKLSRRQAKPSAYNTELRWFSRAFRQPKTARREISPEAIDKFKAVIWHNPSDETMLIFLFLRQRRPKHVHNIELRGGVSEN